MGEVTRRTFLSQTSVGIGVAVTGLAAVTGLEEGTKLVSQVGKRPLQNALPTPIVLHVKDVASGQLVVHAGTTQLAFADTVLVEHLVDAVNRASAASRGAGR